jgi:hypothetical protein
MLLKSEKDVNASLREKFWDAPVADNIFIEKEFLERKEEKQQDACAPSELW